MTARKPTPILSQADLDRLTDEQLAELYRLKACERWLDDYPAFVQECLGRNWPETQDPGVQSALRRYGDILQDYVKTRKNQKTRRNVIVCLPRECCKTELFTIPTNVWLHLHDPEHAGSIVSAVHDDMAVRYTRPIKRIWECTAPDEYLRHFGTFFKPGRKWTDEEMITAPRFSNRQDPTLRASSIEKGMVGSHQNASVWDDPIIQMKVNREGDLWYRKVYDGFQDLNTVVRRDGIFVLVCTRWGQNDLVGEIKERLIAPVIRAAHFIKDKPIGQLPADWETNWPSYAHLAGWDVIYEHVLEKDDQGNDVSRFPVVWPLERIEAVRRDPERGEAWFAAQLMNDPRSRADNPIQAEHTSRMWEDLEDVPPAAYSDLFMCADIAFKSAEAYREQRGDWNVIFVFGQENGFLHLVHGWHGRVTADEFKARWVDILEWAQITHKTRIHTMTMDKSTGGVGDLVARGLYDAATARGLICPRIIEVTRSGKSKQDRIMAVTPYWQSNRMRLVRGVPGTRELVNEMLGILYSSHDDHIDAAADAFYPEVFKPRARGQASTLVDKKTISRFDWETVSFEQGPTGTDDDEQSPFGWIR